MFALDVCLLIVSNSSDERILWFWVHIDSGKVLMGNNVVRKVVGIKDWNIGFYGYIGTSILRIYRKYRRNIGGYFFINIDGVKII